MLTGKRGHYWLWVEGVNLWLVFFLARVDGWLFYANRSEWVIGCVSRNESVILLCEVEWVDDCFMRAWVSVWLFYASWNESMIVLCKQEWAGDCFMRTGGNGWLLFVSRKSESVIAVCEQNGWVDGNMSSISWRILMCWCWCQLCISK